MTYRVVINSAGRVDTIAAKTLPMLVDGGVTPDRITVEVPPVDFPTYIDRLFGDDRFNGVTIHRNPHDPSHATLDTVGVRPYGLGRARNNALERAEVGERLVFVDDDLTGIFRATDPKTLQRIDDVDGFFRWAWDQADAVAVTLWGIYPVRNPYFMKRRLNTKLTYICGGLFGVRVTHEPHEAVVLDDKEDFERSLRHYRRDGRVLRIEDVAIGTTGYAGAGGMQLSRSAERVRAACDFLVDEFPGLATLNLSKKSGWAEVRLADRRKPR